MALANARLHPDSLRRETLTYSLTEGKDSNWICLESPPIVARGTSILTDNSIQAPEIREEFPKGEKKA